jgi:DNA-3-methyladenine glycosylase II
MMPTSRRKQPTLQPARAQAALARDPALAPWVQRIGPPRLRRVTEEPFCYLARSIVFQQLAGKAAATIHGRLVDAVGGTVSPEAISRTSDEALRAAGLSRGKLAAIRDLADKARALRLHRLAHVPDDDVVERLTAVRGIGPWTAHMFLIFALRRPDVWPVGDLGVRAGYARVHGLPEVPTQKEMHAPGEAYRPWRSAAAWYCWRVLETELP